MRIDKGNLGNDAARSVSRPQAARWPSSPKEAFKLIENADVAFLDLKMPTMSGIDFLREA
jgi:CheY-like chemotaxis protein